MNTIYYFKYFHQNKKFSLKCRLSTKSKNYSKLLLTIFSPFTSTRIKSAVALGKNILPLAHSLHGFVGVLIFVS